MENPVPVILYKNKPEPSFERQCGECDLCCKWLVNDVYGHITTPSSPCFYLGKGCTIYEKRPQTCRDYFCAYIQGLTPEWMKPSLTGILVTPERWGPNKEYQMLRAIECGKRMTVEILSWLIQFSQKNNTGLSYVLDGHQQFYGPKEFLEFFNAKT